MNVPFGPAGPPPKPSGLMPNEMPREFNESKEFRRAFQILWKWMGLTGQYLDKLGTFAGLYQLQGVAPTKHNATHLPDSQFDPLPVGVPSGLANANTEGSANAFVRQDHQHARDVRVFLNGSEVGIRNHLNFSGGVTVTDNSVTDAIDVQVDGLGSDVEWLIWVM